LTVLITNVVSKAAIIGIITLIVASFRPSLSSFF
jgi:hypothetical protein